ncbi:uncharacterized protein LOC115632442 isoform X2 [Scaptodrosophila lebanonensis]|uniref:Uncharacterized protein LOC115632442 isoform X1 n=1 Tax=Drosophila lebanonensis TaxID=7225 RepID=A0A6J2UE98_DROLE|nr:uncharacterized protein LOC115632442 isoform X1 [Scaptodrosophila lebanonensis]XP_030385460.1 uncharacterized protein LOC115632442 isoform X2 [Scaptodrosophila lebanonensis]
MFQDHTWVPCNVYGGLPPFAIVAGNDSDGDTIYVGRAYHNGDMLPAKIIPSKQQAYVAWGGEEINKHDFEVLTGHHYCWIPESGGRVPPHALRVGQTTDGEPLFVGRGHYHGSLTPGKVHPSHGCLYIPYGGAEHKLDSYEVLVQPETWVSSHGSNIVPGTILAGHDADGDAIYVGRAYHEGDLLPAKVIPNKSCAYVPYGGHEHVKHDFELLAGYGYGWVPDANGHVPHGAVVCGRTNEGEPLYIGRGHYNGSFTPGKIHQSHNCLYIPFGGQEVRLDHYEVLVKA